MKKITPNTITAKGQAAVELAIFGSIILVAFSVLLMYGQRLDSQQQVKMEAFRKALQKAYERNGSVSYTLKKESRAANLFGGFGQGQASTVGSTAAVMWQKGMSGRQGNRDAESFAYYAINDNEIGGDGAGLPRYPKHQTTTTGDTEFTVYVPASVWNEGQVRKEEYNTTTKREERPGGKIINAKTSDLKDSLRVTLHTRVDTSNDENPWDDIVPLPDYTNEGESYRFEGKPEPVKKTNPVSLGAYARDDINRIDYERLHSGEVAKTIHRERKWQTEN